MIVWYGVGMPNLSLQPRKCRGTFGDRKTSKFVNNRLIVNYKEQNFESIKKIQK